MMVREGVGRGEGRKEGGEREVEMKMLQSLAAGPVKNENRTRIKWHKSAKRKGKKIKNRSIHML